MRLERVCLIFTVFIIQTYAIIHNEEMEYAPFSLSIKGLSQDLGLPFLRPQEVKALAYLINITDEYQNIAFKPYKFYSVRSNKPCAFKEGQLFYIGIMLELTFLTVIKACIVPKQTMARYTSHFIYGPYVSDRVFREPKIKRNKLITLTPIDDLLVPFIKCALFSQNQLPFRGISRPWKFLEHHIRKLAKISGDKLSVVTGWEQNGEKRYLRESFLWKIVFCEARKLGIVFIMNVEKESNICPNICTASGWAEVTWAEINCCEYKSFVESIGMSNIFEDYIGILRYETTKGIQ